MLLVGFFQFWERSGRFLNQNFLFQFPFCFYFSIFQFLFFTLFPFILNLKNVRNLKTNSCSLSLGWDLNFYNVCSLFTNSYNIHEFQKTSHFEIWFTNSINIHVCIICFKIRKMFGNFQNVLTLKEFHKFERY